MKSFILRLALLMCPVLLPSLAEAVPSCDNGNCNWVQMVEARGAKEKLALKAFPSDGIEEFMPIARSEVNGIPKTVEGIWWINAGQAGDILCTFATASWDPTTRTATVPVYGARTFSFHANETGAQSYYPLLASRFTYEVQFTEDARTATITPVITVLGRSIRVPKALVRFSMRYAEDGHWVRESWLFGKRLPDYQFLRVVQADGQRDLAYSDYLKVADDESYLAVTTQP